MVFDNKTHYKKILYLDIVTELTGAFLASLYVNSIIEDRIFRCQLT